MAEPCVSEKADAATASPSVTLITACYNSERFIDRLATSLAKQTSQDFEWICVDDGSTDATIERLLSIRRDFPMPMRVARLPANSGGGLALGVATRLAKGTIIGVMDHDDELIESAIETAIADWKRLTDRQEVCGLLYRTCDPTSGELNGPDFPSGIYEYTYFSDRMRRHSEFWVLMEREALRACLPLEIAEKFCLWGPILEDVAQTAPFYYEGQKALRLYHRDNSASQTNFVRITRKTVWTYARMFRHFDANKLCNPGLYVPIMLNLMRFSEAVHGSPWTGVGLIANPSIRFVARLLYPVYLGMQAVRWGPLTVREAPEIDTVGLMDRIEQF